ncbi:hypothetical protein CDL15_Pgr010111 [Punica granatum]|uniref:Uncharacterized protein n=1 Tax=Punica granatum TaxID=22663 RepID=A0A218WWN0_PUNGR|nr:hypothetical protein CDL15_Pgr010111 [Punica granatum]
MDPRRPKRLTAILREVRPRGSRASSSPCRSPPLGSDPRVHADLLHSDPTLPTLDMHVNTMYEHE